MGPVQIVFIIVNLAVPGWLYFRNGESQGPDMAWSKFEDNMEKIVAATGDFGPCDKDDVVKIFRDLCQESLDRWTEKDSVIMERAAREIVFTCEVRSDASFIQWRRELSQEYDLKCQPARAIASDQTSPAFVFDKKGGLSAIEFFARDGDRQSVNVANCRRKLKLALDRGTRGSGMQIVDRLVRLKSDPIDVITANRMCYQYDVAEQWSKIRAQVER